MSGILIIYCTSEGQTHKIAEFAANIARMHGHEVMTKEVESVGLKDIAAADAILLAASVHAGKHKDSVQHFAHEKRTLLNEKNTAFISVSLSAAQESRHEDAQRYIKEFLGSTGWYPQKKEIVAGALSYTKYGFVKRALIKQIAAQKGLATDTSKDHEYTDWHQVRCFMEEFLESVLEKSA